MIATGFSELLKIQVERIDSTVPLKRLFNVPFRGFLPAESETPFFK